MACLLALFGVAEAWPAEKSKLGEYQVKAAYLYNFTKFVEWPASAFASKDSRFVLGVMGKDPFGQALDRTISTNTVNGRGFIIQRIEKEEEAAKCHILFLADPTGEAGAALLARLKGNPVLTVVESDSMPQGAGMVRFHLLDESVKFQVNQPAVAEAGLRASSKLLAVATAEKPRTAARKEVAP